MLRACRQILKGGGRMAFYTIYIPPRLAEDAYQRAVLAGPRAVASPQEHQAMMRAAGLVRAAETDVTDEFLRIARGLLEARERYAPELRESEGESEFARAQFERRAAVAAIEAGLLRRSLFVAERPR